LALKICLTENKTEKERKIKYSSSFINRFRPAFFRDIEALGIETYRNLGYRVFVVDNAPGDVYGRIEDPTLSERRKILSLSSKYEIKAMPNGSIEFRTTN